MTITIRCAGDLALTSGAGAVKGPDAAKQIIIMSNTYIPLISSGVAGPLGVLHLPRLWLKVSLECRGLLAEGYPGIGKGYDSLVIQTLGLEPEAVRTFIADRRPTYPQFEDWIRSQPGVKLDKTTVFKLNNAIQGYIHDDTTRRVILEANGLPDDGSVSPGAVDLNNLDDWHEFHQAALK
jgi:hypothetical protein